MAGLVAAARARELGAEPAVYEKGTRAGGSMLLSSGFAWRYRSWEVFREHCPGGDPVLQRLILERFDDALDWLEAQGVELLTRKTGNPLTVGVRFDPRQLVHTLAKDVRLGETTDEPTILATGGFPVRLARERGLLLRANPWSEGDGLHLARSRGAQTAGDLDEFYGRAMAAVDAVAEADFVRLGQLYAKFASITPAPPDIQSSPEPPNRMSLPSSPESASLSPPPKIKSSPALPNTTSGPEVPCKVSSKAPPPIVAMSRILVFQPRRANARPVCH